MKSEEKDTKGLKKSRILKFRLTKNSIDIKSVLTRGALSVCPQRRVSGPELVPLILFLNI